MTKNQWNNFTKKLAAAYERSKRYSGNLEKLKKGGDNEQGFFARATEHIKATETLARKTVRISQIDGEGPRWPTDQEEAISVAERKHPDWNIISAQEIVHRLEDEDFNDDPDTFIEVGAWPWYEWDILMEEKPERRKFVYVNTDLGITFQRGVQEGDLYLDEDLVQEQNPELWYEITEEKRVLKSQEDWPDWALEDAVEYMFQKPSTVRMLPPRKATDDELE